MFQAPIRCIPCSNLFVSEPNPTWFGNGPNPQNDPAWSNKNWLKSRFHFSFAEYRNSQNTNFGVLRVLNDDLVQPHRGFGTHPHRDMEIVTYIVQGKLTHADSKGNRETLGRGSIQFMTAGTGIAHSEYNHEDVPLRFIQIWIVPSQGGLKPNYGSYDAATNTTSDGLCATNKLRHLVSNVSGDSTVPVKINQDVDMYTAELTSGEKVQLPLASNRQCYLLCIEGEVTISDKKLKKHDACEMYGNDETIEIEASAVEETENGKVAHFLAFVMEKESGSGRTDL